MCCSPYSDFKVTVLHLVLVTPGHWASPHIFSPRRSLGQGYGW